MPGRRRCRCVGFEPLFLYFEPRVEPRGRDRGPGSELEESVLKVEELESIRLKDHLRLNQEEAAERMGVSQPTFHRIISEAHRKIAEAFVEGKAIRIEGGNYILVKDDDVQMPPPTVPAGYGRGRCCRRGGML
ncbi:MAG TPA: DUF134 domain-containing protein [Desulfobacteria bacterium]|nr:DUF134 domain-containing protein [Desulfobacteria bacterium]